MSPSYSTRSYGLAVTEDIGIPHADAEGITEDLIHAVVIEFSSRASSRHAHQLGGDERWTV
jgi:hemoglobin